MNNYKKLGVANGAPIEECRKAFKKLAKTCHPDLHPNDATAEAKFKEINNALDQLEKGITDDTPQPQHPGQHPGFNAGFSGDNIFEEIIRNMHGSPFGRNNGPAHVRQNITVPLDMVFKGGTYKWSQGNQMFVINGQQYVRQGPTKDVQIPPNHPLDKPIVYKGEGQNGGDLLLYVMIDLSKSKYSSDDQRSIDLHVTEKVNMLDFIVGGSLSITLPSGKTGNIKIAPGQAADVVVKIKGGGLITSQETGNLLVHFSFITPKITDAELIKSLKKIKEQ